MPGQTATKLKTYFAKYAKPTATQFAEFIDTLYEKAASVLPQDNNSFNLGSATKKWKDIYSSGVAYLTKAAVTVLYNASVETVNLTDTGVIDLDLSNVFEGTATRDQTLDFAHLKIGTFSMIIKQDAVGGHNITFEPGIKVTGTIGTNANQVDLLDVVCDGTTVYVKVYNDYK